MIRVLAAALIAAVIVVGVVVLRGGGDDAYRVRAIFDNAGFVIPGEDVKIAGVKVGKITELDVTDDFKAAVTMEITEPGYQDFRRDATCIVRPQSLIGERFVECTPTQPRSAGAEAPPELPVVDGAHHLPVENTMQSVDLDLIGNTMREPERERLSLILNELGTGLAGRGRDLNDVIRRANPALRETGRVLEILAEQNTQLEQLAVNSDRILRPLARDRREVAGAIRESSAVARATAERRAALAATIRTLPEFLDEFEPTMERLGALADESIPVFDDLGSQAQAINRVIRDLGPFSAAALPAVESLGEASKTGIPALTDARPVIADTRRLARTVRPVGRTLREVLESFQRTGGIEYAMDYIFYQAAAINGFDALGHYLRAGLLVNQCVTYVVEPVPGCSANFQGGGATSTATAAQAIAAVGDDPDLRRTAIALARALGQEVENVRRKGAGPDEPAATATPAPSASPSPAPELPQAPTPSPPAPAPAAPSPTTPPASPTAPAEPTAAPAPTSDPANALLDFLFGGDG